MRAPAVEPIAKDGGRDHPVFMSEFDSYDWDYSLGYVHAAGPCVVCGAPIFEVARGTAVWTHRGEPADGHEARPVPNPQFELALENGKTVIWSGRDAQAAIDSYQNYRRRAKVISWRSVKTTYGPRRESNEVRPWIPRKRHRGPSV